MRKQQKSSGILLPHPVHRSKARATVCSHDTVRHAWPSV